MAESLSGVIERVTFHNLDTGFAVLRVLAGERRGIVTVVGHLPSAVAGEFIEAEGGWVQSRDHGMQFKADVLRTTPPGTVEGIARYLGSGLVKGIGPHFAKKIVEVFGERTLAVIDESPSFLAEVKGIGTKRIQRIKQSWDEQKHVRAIMVFLQSYGIGTARAVRIYKTYGDQAIDIVRANPYRLATDIWGVGFQTADQLALNLGLDRNSPLRAQAAVRYVLQKFSSDGHVGCPEEAVIQEAGQATQIAREIIEAAIETARAADEVVRDTPYLAGGGNAKRIYSPLPPALRVGEGPGVRGAAGETTHPQPLSHKGERGASPLSPQPLSRPQSRGEGRINADLRPDDESWLFLKPLFLAEVGVARLIRQLRAGPHPLPAVKMEVALGWVEQKMKLTLADTQRAAIQAAATEKVMVLTGGPGTGKSTIVRGILEIFGAKGLRCRLCCADRPGRQAPGRGHRPRRPDYPPAAGIRPRSGRLPPRPRPPARSRPARRGRSVNGRCRLDESVVASRASAGVRGAGRRCGPVAVRRPRHGVSRPDRLRGGTGRAAYRDFSPGRTKWDCAGSPRRQSRRPARIGPGGRRFLLHRSQHARDYSGRAF